MIVATLTAVIGTCGPQALAASPTAALTHQSRQSSGGEARGGHGGGGVTLPASFPAKVPLPAGKLMSVGTGPGRWSVLLRVAGSHKVVQHRAIRFYVRHGFHKDSATRVHGKGYRIDMVAVNRDHSATSSNLTVVVFEL
jgi:hypothetical protein